MKETLGNKSTRLCVTVVGSSSVGKTALTVQFLTGRFIGDYCSGADMTYRHSVPYLGSLTTNVDILDISRPPTNIDVQEDDFCPVAAKTNAYLVVYSLTNSRSFVRAQEILARLPFNAPKYLVANQLDLQHRRQVSKVEGQAVADYYGCPFDEFSATDSAALQSRGKQPTVKTAFNKLIRQLLSHSHHCPRLRFASFSKLIGAFVSKTRLATNNKLLQRSHSRMSRKSHSVSSGSFDSSNSSTSDISIATITSELNSFLHITPTTDDRYDEEDKTSPIPIAGFPLNHAVASSI